MLIGTTNRNGATAVQATHPTIEAIDVSAYTIPTDRPESDGTLEWDKTTIVVVHATAAGRAGLGYTYADTAVAHLIQDRLAEVVRGHSPMDVPTAWTAMRHAVRNLGHPGLCAMALSAVDNALWDLKARLLDLPLVTLLGAARDRVDVYGSGGFTSYHGRELARQLASWVEQGVPRVKMKVGREPEDDPDRVAIAREAIDEHADLYIDANGAYTRKQALAMGEVFAGEYGVSWFEEPVSSDDLPGLRLLRNHGPAGMDITAGEYGYDAGYFSQMLAAEAVDVIMPDVTRCGGVTGFMQVAALCEAHHLPMSAHCAPLQSLHVGCAARPLRHIEYFHDHVRIERMLFDGLPKPVNGALRPDLSRAGIGAELKRTDAERYAA